MLSSLAKEILSKTVALHDRGDGFVVLSVIPDFPNADTESFLNAIQDLMDQGMVVELSAAGPSGSQLKATSFGIDYAHTHLDGMVQHYRDMLS